MFVYYDMMRRNYNNILILEDDCNIHYKDWRVNTSYYQQIRKFLPVDYDIIFLGGKYSTNIRGKWYGKHLTEEKG